jgi:hypothetical protein
MCAKGERMLCASSEEEWCSDLPFACLDVVGVGESGPIPGGMEILEYVEDDKDCGSDLVLG